MECSEIELQGRNFELHLIDIVTSKRIHITFLLLFSAEKAAAEGSLLAPFLQTYDSVSALVKTETAT